MEFFLLNVFHLQPRKMWGVQTPGGTQFIFWQGVRPEVWNLYPYLMIFLPHKNGWFHVFFFFFWNFHKSGPISKGFFYLKNGWFYIFSPIFVKWDPLLRFFGPKWYPCLRIFGEKVTHLGRTSPYAVNMWVPPRFKLASLLTRSTNGHLNYIDRMFPRIQMFS